ncbi:uncharacterized protein A4U43_C05F33880 [Asparagus officinalis]|uniref:Cytosolic endo-beta-N-acetylglucosaminidase TIM barrel domain-containing protein n=1 Tax=Asparagus officinalis TaxID=4686 RepID=A0A5P1EYB8_ASPOF|nr:uncharacterized protein A4U43_C05F33880 [Asparagus officinalis]
MAPNSSFDPRKPSTPISYPISDLADLESRSYFESFHYPFNKASVPSPSCRRRRRAPGLADRSESFVCHGMMGGYVDDRWVQGGDNAGAYSIWHWYLMDVFVYFSHNLVTIPPPCWTNAGHAHGVEKLEPFLKIKDSDPELCILEKTRSVDSSPRPGPGLVSRPDPAAGPDPGKALVSRPNWALGHGPGRFGGTHTRPGPA